MSSMSTVGYVGATVASNKQKFFSRRENSYSQPSPPKNMGFEHGPGDTHQQIVLAPQFIMCG